MKRFVRPLSLGLVALGVGGALTARAWKTPQRPSPLPLVTGKSLTPTGETQGIGSFPTTAVLSPDGKFIVVSTLGARSQLVVLDSTTGKILSTLTPTAVSRGKKPGLYFGLAFGSDGKLYAARGSDNVVTAFTLSADGQLAETELSIPGDRASGVAQGPDGQLFITSNTASGAAMTSQLLIVANDAAKTTKSVTVPGYPLDVVAVSGKVYVSNEQRGGVDVVDPVAGTVVKRIETGANSTHLLVHGTQLFVANSGSDTVSVIDTKTDAVVQTLLLRPAEARGLPSVTPLGMSVSGTTLYVACADLNAVAVVDLAKSRVEGFIPVGWYPTDVVATSSQLFVTSAKGTEARNPNDKPVAIAKNVSPQYVQNIIEGTASRIALQQARRDLKQLTRQTFENNRIRPNLLRLAQTALKNPGIEHVIYIVKENRTYDQVLGDLPQGNGDRSLTLFGRDVTPNLHALAERFVLLDNFYCSAEVSGDGWNYSTAGTTNEYSARNVVYGYTGKSRPYDYEGTNNGIPVDLKNIPDVATPPGGYLWDKANQKNVSLRNYGMFVDSVAAPRATPEEGTAGAVIVPVKKALEGKTCADFRPYDLTYADSEAWVKYGLPPAARQVPAFGPTKAPSRFTVWNREYQEFLQSGKMPKLMLVRFGRDHTSGTAAGVGSPRAMVADNDYAVGQLVEAVSKGPYWKKTAIFIVEDDAQNGYDHVDAHRSIAFVISPFIKKATKDSRFFNTDSVLHTMESLLKLDPMCLYDATAPVLAVFGAKPENDAPYTAILPAKEIVGEVNQKTAYRSGDSARLLKPNAEESDADEELNDILWHAIKGNLPNPPRRSAFSGVNNR